MKRVRLAAPYAIISCLFLACVMSAEAAEHTVKTTVTVATQTKSTIAPAVPAVSLTPDEQVNIRVYKSANRAVVNVTNISASEDILFNIVPKEGCGSGTIISADGYILTNFHVVNHANQVRVNLWDGTSYPATLVGDDPTNDIAVIKINVPKDKLLTTIQFGDSSRLEVGRRVLAIGNPFAFDRTLTVGIVSSLGRTLKAENGRLIKGIIQTDAAINPGNSGGPLLDSSGRMVGITTAIFSRSGEWAGIGFAIPINIAKTIIPEIIAHHHVRRPEIGIQVVQVSDSGLRVIKLDPDGAAAKAGLSGPKLVTYQDGPYEYSTIDRSLADTITGIDGTPVKSVDDLLSYVEQKKPGQVVTLTVLRAGRSMKIPVKLTLDSST